jgi:3',5'-cyclic AMP phosphodiesterase CpdA
MKRWLALFLAGVSLLLSGCGSSASSVSANPHYAETNFEEAPFRAVVASDLHFISPSLTDNGSKFVAFNEAGDGKTMLYSSEVVDAFLAEVKSLRPDVLILSGDLSFNGAYASHQDLAGKLDQLVAGGIPVLVIPGNHDINNPYAYSFSGETYSSVRNTTAKEFEQFYYHEGYEQARSRDETTLSYVYEARKDLWLLFLDTNSVKMDYLQDSTLQWMKAQLALADEAGIKTIGITHQNVLTHNPLFTHGEVINGNTDIISYFHHYGVKLNLAGHLHIQHVTESNDVTEILTSSLMVSPNHYGVVSADASGLHYQAKSVDVSSWAKAQGKKDSNLLEYASYSASYFNKISSSRVTTRLEDATALSMEDRQAMAEAFVSLNSAYFAGTPLDLGPLSAGLSLWHLHPELSYGEYIKLMEQEVVNDYTTKNLTW